jgi:hypothetical protein
MRMVIDVRSGLQPVASRFEVYWRILYYKYSTLLTYIQSAAEALFIPIPSIRSHDRVFNTHRHFLLTNTSVSSSFHQLAALFADMHFQKLDSF